MQIQGLNEERLFWVDYDEVTAVLIKHITKGELRAIMKKSTEVKFVKHEKKDEFDASKADVLLGQEVIKDWRGVKFGDDAAPCSPENIALVMTKINKFSDFINSTCTDLDVLMDLEKAAVVKN